MEVEGFRGYLNSMKHTLGGKSALISGPQGSCKSSTLNAIEWCLFGKLAYFKSVESKSDLELINVRSRNLSCRVTIGLRKGDSVVQVTRIKRSKSKESSVTVNTGTRTLTDAEADQLIFKELGLTHDDFYRSVYLHQEAIRSLITEEARFRDEAVDRLLGLEKARDILGSIPITKIRTELERLTQQRDKLTAKLEGVIEHIGSEVKKAVSDALKEGFSEDQLTMAEVELLIGELRSEISGLSVGIKLELPEFEAELTTASVTRMLAKAKTFLRESRTKTIEVTGIDSLTKKQSELKQYKTEYNRLATDLNTRREQIIAIEKVYGDETAIEEVINLSKGVIADLEKKRETLDANLKLAKDALFFFEDLALTTCPVCGQPITPGNVRKHLEQTIQTAGHGQTNQIYQSIDSERKKIKDIEGKRFELRSQTEQVLSLSSELKKLLADVGKVIGTKIEPTDFENAIDSELASLGSRMIAAGTAYRDRTSTINNIEAKIEKVKSVNNVLTKREEFGAADLRYREESEEGKGVTESIQKMEEFKIQLETLVEILNEVQSSLATKSISETQDEIVKLYAKLQAHPYYNKLSIEVGTKNVAGIQKNTYLIKAVNPGENRDTYVSARFSAGQMNCAALAIFLSLARTSTTGVDFVMLDDPSQNLDKVHTRNLSDLLAQFAKDRQVIISSQDENLIGDMNSSLKKNVEFTEIHFHEWTKDGCVVASH